jgi:hypothetical protein
VGSLSGVGRGASPSRGKCSRQREQRRRRLTVVMETWPRGREKQGGLGVSSWLTVAVAEDQRTG